MLGSIRVFIDIHFLLFNKSVYNFTNYIVVFLSWIKFTFNKFNAHFQFVDHFIDPNAFTIQHYNCTNTLNNRTTILPPFYVEHIYKLAHI